MPAQQQNTRRRVSVILQHIRRVVSSRSIVWHYERSSRELDVWYWPVNEDWERVTPSDLLDHRVTHLLQAPCCLCPLKTGNDQYTESAIFIARRGHLTGEYIACCATDQCGYLAVLEVPLERIYNQRGLPVRTYQRRDVVDIVPPPVLLRPDQDEGSDADALNVNVNGDRGGMGHPRRHLDTLNSLFQLDSFLRPGLTAEQFRHLFVRCEACGLIMTRRVRTLHRCDNQHWNLPASDHANTSDSELDAQVTSSNPVTGE